MIEAVDVMGTLVLINFNALHPSLGRLQYHLFKFILVYQIIYLERGAREVPLQSCSSTPTSSLPLPWTSLRACANLPSCLDGNARRHPRSRPVWHRVEGGARGAAGEPADVVARRRGECAALVVPGIRAGDAEPGDGVDAGRSAGAAVVGAQSSVGCGGVCLGLSRLTAGVGGDCAIPGDPFADDGEPRAVPGAAV